MSLDSFSLKINPTKITLALVIIAVLLIFLNIVVYTISFKTGNDYLFGLFPTFDLDDEANLPSFFSALLLLFSSLLLGIITFCSKIEKRPYVRHWMILALIFLFLSLDEASQFHEILGDFYSSWTKPAIPIVLLFVLFYLRFFLHLPRKEKSYFTLAFLLYLWGAVGFEILGEPLYAHSVSYVVALTCEETLEMTGVIVFIHILMQYLTLNFKRISLILKD